mgnify:FL=1
MSATIYCAKPSSPEITKNNSNFPMVDWQQIDSVFLDLDGTLLDLRFDNFFWTEFIPARYAKQHKLPAEKAKSDLTALMQSLQGTLDWYCIDFWSEQLDLEIIVLKKEMRDLIRVRPSTEEFLSELSKSRHRVIMATNAHPETIALKMEQTQISDRFDRIISSHEIGYPKEHQQFWNNLAQLEKFDPHRTLFIDDNLSVLRAACDYGIKHLLAICNPDSTKGVVDTAEFESLESFEILTAQLCKNTNRD